MEGGDLAWMPDGKRIVYASQPSLKSLEISTGMSTGFPDSDGLYSPRWSPDGSTLAAMDSKSTSSHFKLYRVSEGRWKETTNTEGFVKWPYWSHDSRFIWYLNPPRGVIGKYDVIKDRYEDVIPIKADDYTGFVRTWLALTPSDEPMILRRRDIQQVYALDRKPR